MLGIDTSERRTMRIEQEGQGLRRRIAPAAWMATFAWVAACIGIDPGNAQAQPRSPAPPALVEFSGPQGGPFPGEPASIPLQNETGREIFWHVSNRASWAHFSSMRGLLQPWASGDVEVSINGSIASLLPVGLYDAYLLHRGEPGQPPAQLAHVRLTVEPQVPSIDLSPGDGLAAGGQVGGPVTPPGKTWTLLNSSAAPLTWSATLDQPWVTLVGETGGTLQPGESQGVRVALDPGRVAQLSAGVHRAELRILRASDSLVLDAREVLVDLLQASSDDGWTEFTPSADTRQIYVSSSSGNDSYSGLAPHSPKRTIAAGKALVRNGYPDWLLLKRGDTWTESIGSWSASGRSSEERILISSYGDSGPRPLLRTGTSSGISAVYSSSLPRVDHVAIVGLHMRAHTFVGEGEPAGVSWLIESRDLLVEDCLIEGYQINVSVPGWGGRKRDVKIRRNVLVDAISTSGTVGHGIYLANCDGVLIEENVLDHNGWNPAIPGAVPSMFRHGIYVQSGSGACTDVVVRRNIISSSASHGLHLRPGGVAEDNLFLRNSIALSLGGGNEPNPGGVVVVARGNVILDGKNIDDNNRRGWGIDLANISQGTVSYNIVANQVLGTMPVPMTLYGDSNGMGVHNTLIERNIFYNWGGTVSVRGSSTQVRNITLRHNDFVDYMDPDQILRHSDSGSTGAVNSAHNRFYSTQPTGTWMRIATTNYSLNGWKNQVGDTTSSALPASPYPAPERTVATYNQSLGGAASHEAFIAQARSQSKANWRPAYTAAAAIEYFREGFELVVP